VPALDRFDAHCGHPQITLWAESPRQTDWRGRCSRLRP
jgi:hypothetical protein